MIRMRLVEIIIRVIFVKVIRVIFVEMIRVIFVEMIRYG